MAAISTNTSILGFAVEATEGTLTAPTGATKYLALQGDLDISPNREKLENAEKKGVIDGSKPIQGAQSPTISFSHYMRGSGTENTAPAWADLMKALLGTQTTFGTERTLTTGSTTTVLNAGSGFGADYARLTPVLVKNAAGGYEVRFVDSVSTDALTLNFPLLNAPLTGTALGRPIHWQPSASGHQAMSMWGMIGNGGAIAAVAGTKWNSLTLPFEAGQLINASWGGEGNEYYKDPIIIASTDAKLDFKDGSTDYAATITARAYKDPHELASALQTAMNAANPANVHTCTYSDTTGKFTFTSNNATFELLWQSGANTLNTVGDKLGFTVSADDTGAQTYTSDNAITLSAAHTPTFDTNTDPIAAVDEEILFGSGTETASIVASRVELAINATNRRIRSLAASSGFNGSRFSSRATVINVTGQLEQYDNKAQKAWRVGDNIKLQHTFGAKDGGNWIPGRTLAYYTPTGVISALDINDDDGLASIEMEITCFPTSSTLLGFVFAQL